MGALGLLAMVHQLRAMERSPQVSSDYLIGVLPNFAAAIAITFVLLSIWADQNRDADFDSAKRPFLVCASISGIGLLAWELFQKTSSRLVFDPHDLGATFVGVGATCMLFYALKPQLRRET
jgi:Ni/Fe-hydrogenase subunit HybB-like protein